MVWTSILYISPFWDPSQDNPQDTGRMDVMHTAGPLLAQEGMVPHTMETHQRATHDSTLKERVLW